jgi:uncharacterized membrane protein YdbT with pleckstrin-like domain
MASFVIGASCLLLALIPGGAWGVPSGIWTVAAFGIIGFAVLSRYSWKFVIDDDRLTGHYGLLSRKQKSIRVGDVRNIELHQPWGDKAFSVGTLAFYATGSDEADVLFWGIKHASDWRDTIQEMVDRAKASKK